MDFGLKSATLNVLNWILTVIRVNNPMDFATSAKLVSIGNTIPNSIAIHAAKYFRGGVRPVIKKGIFVHLVQIQVELQKMAVRHGGQNGGLLSFLS